MNLNALTKLAFTAKEKVTENIIFHPTEGSAKSHAEPFDSREMSLKATITNIMIVLTNQSFPLKPERHPKAPC